MAFNLEAFKRWRKTVPWTDEEIATELDHLSDICSMTYHKLYFKARAEAVRKGRLAVSDLMKVINTLVKFCPCGKKALYRYGNDGRCRDHKMAPPTYWLEKQARTEIKETSTSKRIEQLKKYTASKHNPGYTKVGRTDGFK